MDSRLRKGELLRLKVFLLSTVICLLPPGILYGQPISSQDQFIVRSRPRATTISPGDPFTKITSGDIVNDGVAVGSTGCSWADYDGDGDLDLYACNYGANNLFYVNNGDGTFSKTTATHIIHPGNSNAGIWADYDNDGDLDLVVANNGLSFDMESWFQNSGSGVFTQIVSGELPNDGGASQGVAWADYDNDGHLDIFIPNGFYSAQDNFLYHGNSDGTFSRIKSGDIVNDGGISLCGSWSDFDNDGDVDLFVVNKSEEVSFFYINNGDGTFSRDTTSVIVDDGYGSWGSAWGDYDNDGNPDLFVANWGDDALFRNNGDGSFSKDTTSVVANDGRNSSAGNWADYDNDGDLDLFVANTFDEDNFLYINNNDGTFTKDTSSVVANDGGSSESCAWGDYDSDGDLDLFVSNANDNNFLYQNNGNGNSWINILCVGSFSNRSGIGTKLRAKSTIDGNPMWQLREIEGQSSSRSQNSLNAEFGFGNSTIIDSLRIEWPSGIVDIYTNVAVNQFMTATEGQAMSVPEGENTPPGEFDLKQNFPNPFNPSTTIRYSLPHAGHVSLKVYNMLGQEVATLVDAEQESGLYEVQFAPEEKATGVYFYRLEAGSFKIAKRFVLLK